MSEYCVVVAGGARARFFALDSVELPEFQSGPNLVELGKLESPERLSEPKALWSDNKSGRNRGAGGAHGYDDHRSQHADEFERRFARQVSEQTLDMVRSNGTKHVVMVAQKRMLGFLRDQLGDLHKTGVAVHELGKDLGKLNAQELHRYLADEALLPRRRVPAG